MDVSLFLDVNRFAERTGWLHGFMRLDAVDGVGLFAVIVLVAWWFARASVRPERAVAAVGWTVLGTLAAVGINQPISHLFHRARPFVALRHVEVLVARSHDYSFPSDHAVTAGAVAAGLWIVAWRGGPVLRGLATFALAWAVLLSFARVYVGVHYPGDVLAGLVEGALIVAMGWWLLRDALTQVVRILATMGPLRHLVHAGDGAPGVER